MSKVCNSADDNTHTFYVCDKHLNILINKLKHDTALDGEWLENNSMKLNQDKCYLLVSGQKYETLLTKVGETKVWESNKQNLLGVVIDRNLNLNEYIFGFCKKAFRKLSDLARFSNHNSFEKNIYNYLKHYSLDTAH